MTIKEIERQRISLAKKKKEDSRQAALYLLERRREVNPSYPQPPLAHRSS